VPRLQKSFITLIEGGGWQGQFQSRKLRGHLPGGRVSSEVPQLQQHRGPEQQQPAEHRTSAEEGGQLGRHLPPHHHDLPGVSL